MSFLQAFDKLFQKASKKILKSRFSVKKRQVKKTLVCISELFLLIVLSQILFSVLFFVFFPSLMAITKVL